MRYFFRMNAVLFLLVLAITISVAQQKQKAGNPASSSVTTPETTLTASERPAHRVKGPIQKDRRTPGANAGASQPDEIPLADPDFRGMSPLRQGRLMRVTA